MYGTLSIEQNEQGFYDLVIHYERSGTEFAMDLFSPDKLSSNRQSISEFLRRSAKGLQVHRAKIVAGSLVVAMLPIHMLLSTSASRYGSAYLYAGTQKQQLKYVQQAQGALDSVFPSYFDIAADGTLQFNNPGKSIVGSFHGMDVQVIPFISNHWDRQAGIAALENREDLTDEIAALVEEYGFDGVNVDLENLTASERDDYTEFVSLLRAKLPADKEVSVAVAANPLGWTWGWQASYDYEALGEFSDYLTLMAYDEHYQGGAPGPVAGIGFVENSISYALEHVDAEQIVVGLPLFGRMWSDDNYFEGHSVPLSTVDELIETYNALVFFDEDQQSPKATFVVRPEDEKLSINGRSLREGTYTLWFENERSIAAKLDLIDSYDVKGSSFWQLGQQSDTVWGAYQSWRNGESLQPGPELPDEELPSEEDNNEVLPDTSTPEEVSPPGGSGQVTRPSPSRPSGGSSGGGGGGGGSRGGGSSSISSVAPASTSSAVNTPAATLQQTAVVDTAGSTLYKSASTSTPAVQAVQGGSIVTILQKQADWYQVQLSTGITGYLPAAQLTPHKAAVITPAEGAVVYSAPVMAEQAIATLPTGTAVTILEEYGNGWMKVRLADKRVGYMSSLAAARLSYTRQINIRTTTATLRLRAEPKAETASFGTVPGGTMVQVLEETSNGYTKISWGGTVAYVSHGYIA